MKIALCVPIVEGYGQTETTAASFLTDQNDGLSGHVGGPSMQTTFKLIDIPEMNYYSTDKDENGNPLPRGEVLIGGPACFKAYYKDEENTKDTITEDGFVKTGDVAELR